MQLLDFLKIAVKNSNVKAAMKVTRLSEGTDAPDGYHYLFGSKPSNSIRFNTFGTHPHIEEPFGKQFSSAAGAYQIMYDTWQGIEGSIHLLDFSPDNQDLAFCYLVSSRNCLQRLMDGEFDYFVSKCNTIWASFPGSPYGQPVHTMDDFHKWYAAAGGTISVKA